MAYAGGQLSKAICKRCNFKFNYTELKADPNIGPSFRVCNPCRDQFDPWRLPPRQPDLISIQYPAPDVPFTLVTVADATDTGSWDGGGSWDSGLYWDA